MDLGIEIEKAWKDLDIPQADRVGVLSTGRVYHQRHDENGRLTENVEPSAECIRILGDIAKRHGAFHALYREGVLLTHPGQ